MHGFSLSLTPILNISSLSNNLSSYISTSPRICFLYSSNQSNFSLPTCKFGYVFSSSIPEPIFLSPMCTTQIKNGRNSCYSNFVTRDSRRESPYQVLGISPSATPKEIKSSYRKLALKYHPDVNKEVGAQDKFLRIKHAYNTLLNSKTRRKYDYENSASDYYYSSTERNKNRDVEDEDFYGFGDFIRDLQEEFQNWEASASEGKPKSLWEELAEIGEEFVEFLEKELSLTDEEVEAENKYEGAQKGSAYDSANKTSGTYNEADKDGTIEENIDEIEEALAKLKKELGL